MLKVSKKKSEETNHRLEDIKSDFITIASHQLRTPISGIRWSLDTLLSGRAGELSGKQKDVIQEAYQNNKFMVKVVNDLLRVSRLEEKGVDLVIKPTNLTKIIQETIKKFQDFALANNCDINFSIEPTLPKVYVDPLQIRPVIEALIDNAIRYTKSKGKIKISLQKFRNFLVFKIQDNGIGIPTDQHDLVFSKFFRARNAMKIQTEGLGLDLYIVKKIVEAHGGKIKFKSREKVGTTFYVYLPIILTRVSKAEQDDRKKDDESTADDILKKEREFVSVTVHELKAPLGITKWSLEMLKGQKAGQLNNDQVELINQIYRGNERLLTLVRDLLDLAKLQEGKFDVKPQAVQLETIINDVVPGFQVEAKRKNINLTVSNFKKPLPKISGDPNRIAQVITNLVSNAVKYTPNKGKVTIGVKQIESAALKKIGEQTRLLTFKCSRHWRWNI